MKNDRDQVAVSKQNYSNIQILREHIQSIAPGERSLKEALLQRPKRVIFQLVLDFI